MHLGILHNPVALQPKTLSRVVSSGVPLLPPYTTPILLKKPKGSIAGVLYGSLVSGITICFGG